MGTCTGPIWVTPAANDGSIERADLDGGNRVVIVAPGEAFTPKQIQLHDGNLYWSDREGMRVMRANLDGSGIETPIESGHGETDRADLLADWRSTPRAGSRRSCRVPTRRGDTNRYG